MWARVRQFRDANIPPSPADYTLAEANLDPSLLAIFRAQHPRDIRHAAAVARWLMAHGHSDADLVTAALLHDTGKGDLTRWDRVAYVAAAWVRLDRALARNDSRFGKRRAAARLLGHATAGAARVRAAGGCERVVWLIAQHHSPPGEDPVLALLQEADAAN